MSVIINSIENTLLIIREIGQKVNKTKELASYNIDIPRIDFDKEEKEVAKWYNKYVGSWKDRIKLETNHYNFLSSYLKHKMGEVLYFHKDQDITNRKTVIFSTDCIAAIQVLVRKDRTILNVFMRSSDALNLLPADLLYCWKFLNDFQDEWKIKKKKEDRIYYVLGSCHFYDKDKKKVNKILDDSK